MFLLQKVQSEPKIDEMIHLWPFSIVFCWQAVYSSPLPPSRSLPLWACRRFSEDLDEEPSCWKHLSVALPLGAPSTATLIYMHFIKLPEVVHSVADAPASRSTHNQLKYSNTVCENKNG